MLVHIANSLSAGNKYIFIHLPLPVRWIRVNPAAGPSGAAQRGEGAAAQQPLGSWISHCHCLWSW